MIYPNMDDFAVFLRQMRAARCAERPGPRCIDRMKPSLLRAAQAIAAFGMKAKEAADAFHRLNKGLAVITDSGIDLKRL